MNKFIFTLLVTSFSFAIQIPLNVDMNWEALQSEPVVIEWQKYDGFPFCRATKIISATMEEITQLLEDKENYYKIFDRIEYSELLTPDIVHIKLDMPFPFSDRDYTVKFNRNESATEVNYLYESIVSKDFKEDKK